jgi:hypothetical protein
MRSGAHKADVVIEYTAFERPTRLASVTRLKSMDIHGSLSFEPEGQGTRMGWRQWDIRPRGIPGAARPIVEWFGKRQEWQIWSGLKALLEASESTNLSARVSGNPVRAV